MAATPSSIRALELARARLDDALAASPDDPKLLWMRGKADERLEQYAPAAEFYRKAAALFHARKDGSGEAGAKLDAANALARAGALAAAWSHFDTAIRTFAREGDTVGMARAQCDLAKAKLEAALPEEARPLLEALIAPLAFQEDWESLGWVHDQLARLCGEDREAALEQAKAAFECAVKSRDRKRFGQRLATVATYHLALGNLLKARKYQERAQPYLLEDGDPIGALAGYELLGEVAPDGDRPEVRALLVEAVAFADRVGRPGQQGRLRARLARLELDAGRDDLALELLLKAMTLLHAAGDPRASAPACVLLGRAHWRLGQKREALLALEQAERFHRMLGSDSAAENVAHMRLEASTGEWAA